MKHTVCKQLDLFSAHMLYGKQDLGSAQLENIAINYPYWVPKSIAHIIGDCPDLCDHSKLVLICSYHYLPYSHLLPLFNYGKSHVECFPSSNSCDNH